MLFQEKKILKRKKKNKSTSSRKKSNELTKHRRPNSKSSMQSTRSASAFPTVRERTIFSRIPISELKKKEGTRAKKKETKEGEAKKKKTKQTRMLNKIHAFILTDKLKLHK